MATGTGTYHQQLAERKRAAIITAATGLFLDNGYAGTSLARVAEAAEVSKATLFKQFPTKANLFEAMVKEHWSLADDAPPEPAPGDLATGLAEYGRRYADLMSRPEMVGLYRIVIAEMPRFPALAETHFDVGKMPFFDAVRRYLAAEHDAGSARIDDPVAATTQFMGMISNFAFWPRLTVVGWDPSNAETERVVDDAVTTMVARYGAR
ncbi:TetR/AcrR family transcriptional regulator [Promicromonospora sukumoe]|uniref:AcrR family transcriptional regulator n=1 Tax=Promicromonospora sukumoe TaxID=88382 RepID=A0A7W3J8E1_9MICO|nr:TetR/AcrR family transcriptional regulator [Promicromonospora sukumoe]MBA8808163.1 AcrR family transcriptional regulator [Promicromonospora sukumoe]